MVTNIARPSLASLYLVTRVADVDLAIATGFVVERGESAFLVTNYHVLAGREPGTEVILDPSGATPDTVVVLHNVAGQLGTWRGVREPVRDDDGPLWLVHPSLGARADVVALPLRNTSGCDLYPHDTEAGAAIGLGVAQQVSIVGFPFGRTGGGGFGIWVQGTVATEPGVEFDDLPCFLVDSRTRSGQSGSPVLLYYSGGMVPMADGSSGMFAGPVERLLGVYSGRISAESDLGVVWRREVVVEILEGQVRGTE